jgi:7,8-dihydropterin-6-yl-methyl-4-(beta-D-ribofuranosyl)aminobenzene 5'-phosphate synthase
MIIKEDKKLTVFSGCAHNGIKNIISTTKDIFREIKIKTIIGGFHLQAGKSKSLPAQDDEIYSIAQCLTHENIEKVYTGHCTGIKGFNILKSVLKDKIERIYSGKEIFL